MQEELFQFLAYVTRVSAVDPLQITEKPAHFIKIRLLWESDTYCLYLRNTSIVAMKHLEANVTATLSEKAYNLSIIGVATPNVPDQVSV